MKLRLSLTIIYHYILPRPKLQRSVDTPEKCSKQKNQEPKKNLHKTYGNFGFPKSSTKEKSYKLKPRTMKKALKDLHEKSQGVEKKRIEVRQVISYLSDAS